MKRYGIDYFPLTVQDFRQKVKARNLSFTLAFVYAVCKCANEIEAFRYRFLDGRIVLFDHIDTAFTYLNQDTKLFKVVNVPLRGNIQEYLDCLYAYFTYQFREKG